MIKVGITGQAGFIGTHQCNYFGLKENIQQIEFCKIILQQGAGEILLNFIDGTGTMKG